MRSTRRSLFRALVGASLLAAACAGAPKPAASPPRLKDAAPEKVAAQRSAVAPGIDLEQSDERWGIEAARERRRQQDAARPRPATDGGKAVDVTAPPRP